VTSAADMFAAFSAATVHEATGSDFVLSPEIRPLVDSWRVSGRALTVSTAPGNNLWVHRAIYRAEPGDVLVVSTGGGVEYGYWGEILATAALERNIAGLVIDGGVRDGAELATLGMPVFSRGRCIRGTGKDADLGGGIGLPIEVTGVSIATGDIVVGDGDGVVIVPADRASAVAQAAAARLAKEDVVLDRLRKGATTLEIYGWT
jgi:4-hydroxy-4-methyl-2-oxoglutarate aldolase